MSYEKEVVEAITKLVAVTEGLKDDDAAELAQKLILQQESAKMQADNTLGMAIVTDMMEAQKSSRLALAEILGTTGSTTIGPDDRPYLGLGDPDAPESRAGYGEQYLFDDERRARAMVDYGTRIEARLPSLEMQVNQLAASKYLLTDTGPYDQAVNELKQIRSNIAQTKENYEMIDNAAQKIAEGSGARWTQKLFKGKKLAAYELTNQNLAKVDSLLARLETTDSSSSSY